MKHKLKAIGSPVWITWENQRRNREVAKRIGARLYEWKHIDNIENRLKKYIYGIAKTAYLLLMIKPKVVFCQNPSIVLSLFVCLMGKIFSFSAIVDAHNGGLFPLEGRSSLLNKVSRYIQKNAPLTLVTNQNLKRVVEINGGRAFILPDPIPNLPVVTPYNLAHTFNILFICSFEDDEPYENVFTACTKIDKKNHIFVTGNYKKKQICPLSIPKNISLLGYVSEHEYIKMIHSVDITIDLTLRDDCLVCGAYESVAAEKPMIISNTSALRCYFYKGALYTDNSAESIAYAIEMAKNEYYRLLEEIRQLKIEKQIGWSSCKDDFKNVLEGIVGKRDAHFYSYDF